MSPFSPSFYAKWPSFFVGDAGFRLIQPLRPQSRIWWEKQWSTWNQNQKNEDMGLFCWFWPSGCPTSFPFERPGHHSISSWILCGGSPQSWLLPKNCYLADMTDFPPLWGMDLRCDPRYKPSSHFLGSKRLSWTLRKLDPEMKSIGATSKRGTGYLALSALHWKCLLHSANKGFRAHLHK